MIIDIAKIPAISVSSSSSMFYRQFRCHCHHYQASSVHSYRLKLSVSSKWSCLFSLSLESIKRLFMYQTIQCDLSKILLQSWFQVSQTFFIFAFIYMHSQLLLFSWVITKKTWSWRLHSTIPPKIISNQARLIGEFWTFRFMLKCNWMYDNDFIKIILTIWLW